jgi:DNA-binding response OmpR family regulator
LGACDYVVKPFLPREFAAWVRAALRRTLPPEPAAAPPPASSGPILGPLKIRSSERAVTLDGVPVPLTVKEFDVVLYLASRPGQPVSREELLREVWGSQGDWQDPSTVTEHVRRLRRKLEADPDNPQFLHTVRGVGYRFGP